MRLLTRRRIAARSEPMTLPWGVLTILLFNLLSAGDEVFLGNRLQRIDSTLLLLLVFLPTTGFFVALQLGGAHGLMRRLVADRRDVVLVNVLSAITWIGFFVGLRYLEPAIVAAIIAGIGPIVMLPVAHVVRPGSVVRRSEVVAAAGILAALGLLVQGAASAHTGVHVPPALQLLGVGASTASGLATVSSVLCMKRLSDRGWSPSAVMAVRFWLLLLLAGAVVAVARPTVPRAGDAWLSIGLIVAAGTIAPLYLFQVGVKLVEPVPLAVVVGAAPVFTVVLQGLDPRLHWSVQSVVGVMLTAACIGLMVLAGASTSRRKRSEVAA